MGQTSVCIVAGGYSEWRGSGNFVGCEGPLENFCWVSMVMSERTQHFSSQECVRACVCVGGGTFQRPRNAGVGILPRAISFSFSSVFVVLLLLLTFLFGCLKGSAAAAATPKPDLTWEKHSSR